MQDTLTGWREAAGPAVPSWKEHTMPIIYHISDLIGTGRQISPSAGESHVILDDVTIGSTASSAIYSDLGSGSGDVDFLIDGRVVGLFNAIYITNSEGPLDVDLFIGSNGSVTSFGLDAILITGGSVTPGGRFALRNDGLIRAEDEGITASHLDEVEILNTGEISSSGGASSAYAIVVDASDTRIVNSGSIISANAAAIYMDAGFGSNPGDPTQIVNTGLISGPALAVRSDRHSDHIDNDGIIQGDLRLGEGESLDGDTAFADLVNNSGTIYGNVLLGAGEDKFFGETGEIFGEVKGEDGDDIIKSGLGDDFLNGGEGRDKLYGGAGNDTAVYSDSSSGVRVNLNAHRGWGGEALGDRLYDIENLVGSAYDDVLIGDGVSNSLEGGAGGDTLDGEGGNDVLFGQSGDDTLIGGDGNDILNGGLDRDILWGGDGVDIFEFLDVIESGIGSSRDVIKDFEQGVDLLDLATVGATSFSSGGFTNTAGEVTYKLIGGGTKTVIEYDHDGDGAADFQILMTNGGFTITADDFILG